MRTERYKLIRFPGTVEIEFYDLVADPTEATNLAGKPALRAAIIATEKELEKVIAEAGIERDQLPTKGGGKKRRRQGADKKRAGR